MNKICFLIGHKMAFDSGYHCCVRCGWHEYYHGPSITLPWIVWMLFVYYPVSLFWVIKRKLYDRCTCGKINRILWFKVGKHDDQMCDLPF